MFFMQSKMGILHKNRPEVLKSEMFFFQRWFKVLQSGWNGLLKNPTVPKGVPHCSILAIFVIEIPSDVEFFFLNFEVVSKFTLWQSIKIVNNNNMIIMMINNLVKSVK